MKLTAEAFLKRVRKTKTCWIWHGSPTRKDYGRLQHGAKLLLAHRVSYELFIGQIPDGLVIDHLCRTPACVNPDHLEAVTNAENVLRGEGPTAKNARKTHCRNGHAYDDANLYRTNGWRQCKICRKLRRQEYERRRWPHRIAIQDAKEKWQTCQYEALTAIAWKRITRGEMIELARKALAEDEK